MGGRAGSRRSGHRLRIPGGILSRLPRRPLLGWTAAGAAVALSGIGVWLTGQNRTGSAVLVVHLTLIVNAVVGAVIVSRTHRNMIGWILLAIALDGALAWCLWEYGFLASNDHSLSLPFGTAALWAGSWLWIPVVGCAIPALLARLPDGRAPRTWRAVEVADVVATAAVAISVALMPGRIDARVAEPNPIGLAQAQSWLVGLGSVGLAVVAGAMVVSAVVLLQRLARAHGDEREQLKWIASAAALIAAALVYGLGRQILGHEILFDALTPFLISTTALPLAIGIAILKYRLYDIDLVINRTLVYGGLTALLAGLYTLWLALTQKLVLFSGQKSDIAILLTAFVAASAFTPVKNWLQKTVDKRFSVRDPASLVDSMREQIQVIVNVLDAQRIARRFVEESAATYRARYVALALGPDGASTPFHASGDTSAKIALRIALHADGRQVGVLSMGGRRGGAAYTARDHRALQQCADAVGEAIALDGLRVSTSLSLA